MFNEFTLNLESYVLPVTNDTVKCHSWPNCYKHTMASSVLLLMWVGNICATDTTVVIFAEFSFVSDYINYMHIEKPI